MYLASMCDLWKAECRSDERQYQHSLYLSFRVCVCLCVNVMHLLTGCLLACVQQQQQQKQQHRQHQQQQQQ